MFGSFAMVASGEIKQDSVRKLISLLEIFATWTLIEATIWSSGKTQSRLFWISFLFIVGSTIAHRPKLDEIGLSLRGLRSSLWVIPLAVMISSAAILLAWAAGTLHPLFGAVAQARHSSGYAIWAVLQQFILQSYFFLRFERLVSARSAILLSGGLFCLAHIPNPVLLITCLIAGCLACAIFRRNRNIYALGVAHAILGLTIAITVPDDIQRHMRVGIGYYNYHVQRPTPPRG